MSIIKNIAIIIPTMNRYKHLKKCLESFKRCQETNMAHIFVALDYPPEKKFFLEYHKIKSYVENSDFSCFGVFKVIERKENHGYWNNIEDIKNYVMERYDVFITLQDDIEISQNFLRYFKETFSYYYDDDNVIAVSGYSYPVNWVVSPGTTCIKQNFVCSEWGIGYWTHKYKKIAEELDGLFLYNHFFEAYKNGSFDNLIDACLMDYSSVLSENPQNGILRKVCDISLRILIGITDYKVIMPVLSKTRNHGFDGSGIYCQSISKDVNNLEIFADDFDYNN